MFDDLFDWTLDCFDNSSTFDNDICCHDDCFSDINPGSGLPMDECSGIDVGGYVYGDGPD